MMIQNDLLTPTQPRRIPSLTLEHILREVARRVPELHWATIASLNGVVQATYDPFHRAQPDRILAAASAVLALGERVFRKLQRGQLTHLTLAGEAGVLVARLAGKSYILAISIPTSAETSVAVDALAQAATVLETALGQTVVSLA
jgi:predicted regulator of Ras-like GTPase activity (Roadblock/LC7/MglB family)